MAYDETKDVTLWVEKAEFEKEEIVLSVHQYNDGQPKLQITRIKYDNEETTYAKLGRLTVVELQAIIPIMESAKQFLLNKNGGAE